MGTILADIRRLVRRLSKENPNGIVVEATGGWKRRLPRAFGEANLPVVVMNPRRVRDFAKAAGRLAKTDKIDAEILALFGETMEPDHLTACKSSVLLIVSSFQSEDYRVGQFICHKEKEGILLALDTRDSGSWQMENIVFMIAALSLEEGQKGWLLSVIRVK